MNSIKKEDIKLPSYEEMLECIYNKYMADMGQEFDYANYSKALDKIEQIASDKDYTYLEHTITECCQNSAMHGFMMGARMTMVILFGWQQASGSSHGTVEIMEFMKGGNYHG